MPHVLLLSVSCCYCWYCLLSILIHILRVKKKPEPNSLYVYIWQIKPSLILIMYFSTFVLIFIYCLGLLVNLLPVTRSQVRKSLKQSPKETQQTFMACSTTCNVIISDLQAQNSQVNNGDSLYSRI